MTNIRQDQTRPVWAVIGSVELPGSETVSTYIASKGIDAFEWFADSDAEELNVAIALSRVAVVLFQSEIQLFEFAIDGSLDFDAMIEHGVDIHVIESIGSGLGGSIELVDDAPIMLAYRAAGRRQVHRRKRQTIAAAILSFIFVSVAATWFAYS